MSGRGPGGRGPGGRGPGGRGPGGRDDCPRTRGLVDRIVDGSVGEADREHAATCAACGGMLARAARFDDELERSAGRLVGEELPRGVLDPGLAGVEGVPRMRPLAPGATAGFAALAVVVIATVIGIRPVLSPGATGTTPPLVQEAPGGQLTFDPKDPLLPLGVLTVELVDVLQYSCGDASGPRPTSAAAGPSATCTAPSDAGPYTAAVTLESESGTVVRVTITGEIAEDLSQQKAQEARDALAAALAKVTQHAFTSQGPAIRAANFVFAKASQMSGPSWAMGIEEAGVRIALERRDDGEYVVHLSVRS